MAEGILLLAGAVFGAAAFVAGIASVVVDDRKVVRALWTVLLTQVAIVSALLVPCYLGGAWFAIAVGAIGLRSLWELLRLQDVPVSMRVCGVAAGAAVVATAHLFWQPYVAIPVLALALLVLTLFIDLPAPAFTQAAVVILAVVYTCLCPSYLLWIRQQADGFALVAFVYGVSEVHDGFALVVGKAFGRRRIFPTLSQNKTVVGSAAGVVAALAVAVAFHAGIGVFTLGEALVGALLVVASSLMGDLAASRIKREQGVKDYGAVLPMQGGVLDIYDALIATAPVFAAWLWLRGWWA